MILVPPEIKVEYKQLKVQHVILLFFLKKQKMLTKSILIGSSL
jgi:hypothetical protein